MGSGVLENRFILYIVKLILGGKQNIPLEPLPTEIILDPRVGMANMTQMIYI